jgi:hypothetical protein
MGHPIFLIIFLFRRATTPRIPGRGSSPFGKEREELRVLGGGDGPQPWEAARVTAQPSSPTYTQSHFLRQSNEGFRFPAVDCVKQVIVIEGIGREQAFPLKA